MSIVVEQDQNLTCFIRTKLFKRDMGFYRLSNHVLS